MKIAIAETSLDIYVHCPYCDNFQDVIDELREELGDDLRAKEIEREIVCDDKDCGKTFLVNEITY